MKRNKAPFYLVMSAALALGGVLFAQDMEDAQSPDAGMEVTEEAVVEEAPAEENLNVDMSVEEINRIMSLPVQARLGREADEDPNQPFNVFASPGSIESLLGPRPKFVYFPEDVDPMILPWVREQIVVQEKMEDARRAYENANKQRDRGQAARALDILNELQQKYTEASNNKDVAKLKQDVEKLIAALSNTGPEQLPDQRPQQQELPRWIVSNTRGVVLDRDNPRDSYVLLGDFILQEGDHVELFPAVVVKEILPQKVVYEFENVEHVVSVQSL